MEFPFDLVADSPAFQRVYLTAHRRGLVRDLCVWSSKKNLPLIQGDVKLLLKVCQKSDLWLHLRQIAHGTASSVGKLIKGCTGYPSWAQVTQEWREKLDPSLKIIKNPSAMKSHMKWGNTYEDAAQLHFSLENNLVVAQVGTIHLPLRFVEKVVPYYHPSLSWQPFEEKKFHFLVSPDGIVGERDTGGRDQLPTELLGMLEIKCISPFHHVDNDNGTVSLTEDMEARQWEYPEAIPFVYVVQMSLQALAGLYRLKMDKSKQMWFVRWSPKGFAQFQVSFDALFSLGGPACLLFAKLKERLKSVADVEPVLNYTPEEQELARAMNQGYERVMAEMSRRYVSFEDENGYEGFYRFFRAYESNSFIVE